MRCGDVRFGFVAAGAFITSGVDDDAVVVVSGSAFVVSAVGVVLVMEE